MQMADLEKYADLLCADKTFMTVIVVTGTEMKHIRLKAAFSSSNNN